MVDRLAALRRALGVITPVLVLLSVLSWGNLLHAQDAPAATSAGIEKSIETLSAEITKADEERQARERELKDNEEQQRKAQRDRDAEAEKRLKNAADDLGRKLNGIRDRISAKERELPVKYRAMRVAARAELATHIDAAVTAANASKPADAKAQLAGATAVLVRWRKAFREWQAYDHTPEDLTKPFVEAKRQLAESEKDRLAKGVEHITLEAELEAEELKALQTVADRAVNHDDWKSVKADAASLQKLVAERKADLDKRKIDYGKRLEVVEAYLEGK